MLTEQQAKFAAALKQIQENKSDLLKLPLYKDYHDDLFATLLEALQKNTTATKLQFSNLRLISLPRLAQVVEVAKTKPQLTHFGFSSDCLFDMAAINNYLAQSKLTSLYLSSPDLKPNNMPAFCESLRQNTTLKQLSINHAPLSTRMDLLARTIANAKRFTTLSLGSCNLTTKAVKTLVERLYHNEKLQVLDLSNNHLMDESAKEIAKLLTKPNSSLLVVDLSNNHFKNEGVLAIASALRTNKKLRGLIFSGAGFTENSMNEFADALAVNNSLITLSLNRCWELFPGGGFHVFGLKLLKILFNKLRVNTSIKCLSLEKMEFDDESFAELTTTLLKRKSNVTYLSLQGCAFVNHDLAPLFEIVETKGLKFLNLNGAIRKRHLESIINFIKSNKTTCVLKLCSNDFNLQERQAIVDAYMENPKLLLEIDELSEDQNKQFGHHLQRNNKMQQAMQNTDGFAATHNKLLSCGLTPNIPRLQDLAAFSAAKTLFFDPKEVAEDIRKKTIPQIVSEAIGSEKPQYSVAYLDTKITDTKKLPNNYKGFISRAGQTSFWLQKVDSSTPLSTEEYMMEVKAEVKFDVSHKAFHTITIPRFPEIDEVLDYLKLICFDHDFISFMKNAIHIQILESLKVDPEQKRDLPETEKEQAEQPATKKMKPGKEEVDFDAMDTNENNGSAWEFGTK